MTVAVVDYGSGNLRSVANALARAAAGTDRRVTVTSDPEAVRGADRIVLPGVGAFADCKRGLAGLPGMIDALDEAVRVRRRPFLGICVGMQLLADEGREHETTAGLGWVHGVVVRLAPEDLNLKVPHMGWNELELIRPHPLFAGIVDGSHMYFVHSYHFAPSDPDDRAALVRHGGSVVAAIAHDNLFGTQFHPEKSQAAGLRLLDNFLHWSP